jgi:hypothetical protein
MLSAGQATFTTSSLAAGSQAIKAVYSGDANHAGSASPALIHTVEKQGNTTTTSSTPNPSATGQTVTFTAVVAVTPSDGATPTGMVSFYAGDTLLGTASLDAKGTATFSTPALTAGKYNVKAIYSGSAAFAESTSTPITHVVQ